MASSVGPAFAGGSGAASTEIAHRASKPAQVEIIIRILSSLQCSRHDNRKPPLLPQAEVPQVYVNQKEIADALGIDQRRVSEVLSRAVALDRLDRAIEALGGEAAAVIIAGAATTGPAPPMPEPSRRSSQCLAERRGSYGADCGRWFSSCRQRRQGVDAHAEAEAGRDCGDPGSPLQQE